jgi:hypothetical protein
MADYRLDNPDFVARLRAGVATVEAELASFDALVGPYTADTGWHDRHRQALKALSARLVADHKASIRDRFDGARVAFCGVASSSTSGVVGALNNWLTAARAKLEKAGA